MTDTPTLNQPSISLERELQDSYLDYSMSVIVGRALPDVRDGLKPVHRRALFSMDELNNSWNKSYKKSARIVGHVIGKYHPHGDSAVYDTIVRMAQNFSLRYPLVDGQGNFGSIDGDNAAAMRYTEIRMSKMAQELLTDIEKGTVDFSPNYDGTEQMPDVLPARFPNLLVNGSSGIAIGMATNIPPHNIGEVLRACLALLDNPDLSASEIMQYIPGPDFPTGAILNGTEGLHQAYETGCGRIIMRACAEVTHVANRDRIVITEIPYQVNKARLIERIADLVKQQLVEGISEIRDESDKDGLRVAIDIKQGEVGEIVLNNLYAKTDLQKSFNFNMVAIDKGVPRTFGARDMLNAFLMHRREVVTRRSLYLLAKARARGHTLEGLAVAIANIDRIIKIIRGSANPTIAHDLLLEEKWSFEGNLRDLLERTGTGIISPEGETSGIMQEKEGSYYQLSSAQSKAILELRLHRLTGLEHDKLLDEYNQKLEEIIDYKDILSDPDRLSNVIRVELNEVLDKYQDKRKTRIIESHISLNYADLITEEDRVVTLSGAGYAKSQSLVEYRSQKRGGVGKSATKLKNEDWVEHLLVVNTHQDILCFTTLGKVFVLKAYEIPIASRQSKGKPIINLLQLSPEEKVTNILPVPEYKEGNHIIMVTKMGVIKKTNLTAFSNIRRNGLKAINIDENDMLIDTKITDGDSDIMLFSNAGKANRFHASQVRAMGRTARGVRGMRLEKNQHIVSMMLAEEGSTILTVSKFGYGKRTKIEHFSAKSRGTKGMISMKTSERNGAIVSAIQIKPGDDIMLISSEGVLVRTSSDSIPELGRATQGVRVIRLLNKHHLIGVAPVVDNMDADEGEDGDVQPAED